MKSMVSYSVSDFALYRRSQTSSSNSSRQRRFRQVLGFCCSHHTIFTAVFPESIMLLCLQELSWLLRCLLPWYTSVCGRRWIWFRCERLKGVRQFTKLMWPKWHTMSRQWSQSNVFNLCTLWTPLQSSTRLSWRRHCQIWGEGTQVGVANRVEKEKGREIRFQCTAREQNGTRR